MERLIVFKCEECSRSVYLDEVENNDLSFECETCPECLNGEEYTEFEKEMSFFI